MHKYSVDTDELCSIGDRHFTYYNKIIQYAMWRRVISKRADMKIIEKPSIDRVDGNPSHTELLYSDWAP